MQCLPMLVHPLSVVMCRKLSNEDAYFEHYIAVGTADSVASVRSFLGARGEIIWFYFKC